MKIIASGKMESVALFVDALLKMTDEDSTLIVTIRPTPPEDYSVECVIEDSVSTSPPSGSEPQQTISNPRPLQESELNFPDKLCWSGPTYSHGPHYWREDKPGGKRYYCPGASTDRT